NSQTDLRALVDSIVERLPQTLLVTRVAVFLSTDDPNPGEDGAQVNPGRHFELAASHGLTNLQATDLSALDVRFLDFDREDANDHIFLENPQQEDVIVCVFAVEVQKTITSSWRIRSRCCGFSRK